MSVIARMFPENPVLVKEMRTRMRGARAYWVLLGYLGFLTAVLLFTYSSWQSSVAATGTGASDSSETGKMLFNVLLVCQSFLVLFITPAITSGSITIEREQQTLDMLTMTRMTRGAMVGGKLISAVSFTALLLITSLPLVSICFMLGGVDPAMVISTYLAMLMGSFLIGAIGLAWSSVCKTTTVAVLLTYLTMLFFAVLMAWAVGTYVMISQSPMAIGGGGGGSMVAFSLTESWCGPLFLGIHGFEYMGFAVLSAIAGILLAAVAMARLETWPDRRGGLLRGLTTLVVVVQAAACYTWWLDRIYGVGAAGSALDPAVAALCVPVLMLMVLVPVFATGELHPIEARNFGRYLLSGFTPRGLARGRLASGVPFLLLLAVLCIGAYVLVFACFGKVSDVLHSASLPGAMGAAAAPSTAPAPPALRQGGYTGTIRSGGNITVYRNGVVVSINGQNVVRAPAAPPATPLTPTKPASIWESAGDFPQAVLVVLAFVFGFGLFSQFLSVAFGNRWIGIALAYLSMVVILFLPVLYGIASNSYEHSGLEGGGFLDPLWAIGEMTNTKAPDAGLPFWLLGSVSWIVLGSLSLLATVPFVARRAMKSSVVPYEELVINV